ncbi:MAG: hypothetical protein LBI04_10360 [Treponema sp.]|jgi:uncharacterized membrane protein YcgQ (UPF0703/DUF1980 family)|nr:hypothetical protein [Treponema sp.]
MRRSKSAGSSLIIAAVIITITASIFTVSYISTKKKIEDFNSVLGKDETVNFSQVMRALLNDNKFGTTEENVRYLSMSPNKGVVEIKEKMFISQVNDVYLNAEDYLGKTIKLEGIFKQEQYSEWDDPYRFVLRYGPGCCGNDGNVGFEIKWEDNTQPYPDDDSWVETTGVLKFYGDTGYMQYLYLDLISLNVLSRRGAEIVLQ